MIDIDKDVTYITMRNAYGAHGFVDEIDDNKWYVECWDNNETESKGKVVIGDTIEVAVLLLQRFLEELS